MKKKVICMVLSAFMIVSSFSCVYAEDMVSYEAISDTEIEENISDETIEKFEVKEENSFSEEQTTEEQENLIENVTMEDENISEETQVEETTVEEVPVTDEICMQILSKVVSWEIMLHILLIVVDYLLSVVREIWKTTMMI